ncbi:CMP-N-acetylneuraminate-beta-galactosamide-alpha-2,3-sialyltransferase 1-like [Trichomycterus rosablanca]|uniref:CMP-N-acetylneuraminate-beta-galactosamide- alpha-2,3-sialyltransferase 1-like n=1 Tax=Trichomycterus rosablanca TaxID=2290929 RepID=UPI002F360E6C
MHLGLIKLLTDYTGLIATDSVRQELVIMAVLVACMLVYTHIALNVTFNMPVGMFSTRPCACLKRCLKEEQNSWFAERYNSSVPKLLNRRNSDLSNSTKRWWLRLQNNRSNYSAVIEPLFSMFPDKEHYTDAGPDRCRTCAVVGNSANLLESKYGALIDTHDFIFRMNMAPTAGYETDVGSKTTHRSIYPESAVDFDNSTHLLMLPFKVLDLEWLISIFTTQNITRTYKRVRRTIKAQKENVMILNPEFIKYVYDSWLRKNGKYPSTGFIILMLATHICDQVNVFGFGANKEGKWLHYFEKRHRPNLNGGVHRGSAEFNILLELEKREMIHYYRGW